VKRGKAFGRSERGKIRKKKTKSGIAIYRGNHVKGKTKDH